MKIKKIRTRASKMCLCTSATVIFCYSLNRTFLPPANEVWGKVIFCTCLSFCSRGKYLGRYPESRYAPWQVHPRAVTSPKQVHPQAGTPHSRYRLGRYTPRQVHTPEQVLSTGRYTPGQVHPWQYTPGRYTPWQLHPRMHAGIRSASRWYASYWNAFLFKIKFQAYLLFRSSE